MFKLIVMSFALTLGFAQTGSFEGHERNLALYEKAGPYELPITMSAEERSLLESEIRGFLWNHWNQKRLGYLKATWGGREGNPNQYLFHVEPDSDGIWHVSVEIERTYRDRKRDGSLRTRQSQDAFKAYLIERFAIEEAGTQRPILDDEVRPPSSFILILKDKSGKRSTEI